jgi:beta-lactamase regulating signal transducer with metallopeptidase domain
MFGVAADISLRILAAAAAVGLVLVVLRVRSGAARHAAWSAVLLAMLTMPLLTAIVPKVDVPVPSTLALDLGAIAGQSGIDDSATSVPAVRRGQNPAQAVAAPAPDTGSAQPSRATPSGGGGQWRTITTVLYAAGALFLLIRLAGGWYLARRLVAGATRLDLDNRFPVLESAAIPTPVTIGVFGASVLLPITWRDWPADKLGAVLAHENAHIARRDSLVALLAHLNRAIFWFHPLAWWLERTIAVTAEHACDETAARQVGQPRRYAEVLIDMAEAVRTRGQRVSWQAIGVDGSGLLGARIDRLLRGDAMARMPAGQRVAVAAACALALALAIACRQQIAATPLQPDPEVAKRLAAQPAETKRFEASRDMTSEEADALEARITQNAEDWDARDRLVTYYSAGRAVPWGKKVPGLRRHALWLIEHHPEHDVQPPPLSPKYDPEGFAVAVRLWEAHLAKPDASPFLVYRAARFFAPYDKPRAEQLILRGMTMDPQSQELKARLGPNIGGSTWALQLGWLYGSALIGSEQPAAPQFNAERSRSPYAMAVRKKLEASDDAPMLARVGNYIVRATGGRGGTPEIKALGRSYLERALQLNPDLLAARVSLVAMRIQERHHRFYEARIQKKPVEDQDRLTFEAGQAQSAFMRADNAFYYKNDEAAARALIGEAVKHARTALELAEQRPEDLAYSSVVAKANFMLAEAAIRAGDRDAAVQHLMKATQVPATEEITYYPVSDWLRPVNHLLAAGERERVVEFLEAYARLSAVERERLLKDANDIRQGRMPVAYQSMVTREAAAR